MARDDSTGAGAVVLAFLAGAVAGAAVALLYAPASGEETREYLGQRAREGRDKVADFKREMSRAAAREEEQES
jgi:gas vesicle protein